MPRQAPGRRALTHRRPPAGCTGTSPTPSGKTGGLGRRGAASHARPLAAREAWPFPRSYHWDYCDDSSAISRLSTARAARRLAPDPPFISFCGSTPTQRVSSAGVDLKLGDSPGAVARVPIARLFYPVQVHLHLHTRSGIVAHALTGGGAPAQTSGSVVDPCTRDVPRLPRAPQTTATDPGTWRLRNRRRRGPGAATASGWPPCPSRPRPPVSSPWPRCTSGRWHPWSSTP